MSEQATLPSQSWRKHLYIIIFESDTKAGKAFDVLLILCILLSVFVVMLESVKSLQTQYSMVFLSLEWFFTVLFTVEYILRLMCAPKPFRYAFSFFGLVDVLSIMPTYLDIFFPGSHYLLTIRILRVLRIFRVLKLIQYIHEINFLKSSLYESRRKILVFMFAVLTVMIVLGSLMYLIEGEENGFSNIPVSIYWAIVTMSTVGYGDIAPNTVLGKILASISILIGYAIIAVPTGIVTARMIQSTQEASGKTCSYCGAKIPIQDAVYCHKCGQKIMQ